MSGGAPKGGTGLIQVIGAASQAPYDYAAIALAASADIVSDGRVSRRRPMPRYFFHSADGERCVDQIGTVFETETEARAETIRRAGIWIAGNPELLVTNQDCRMETSLEDKVSIFSVIMFSVDPRSFGKGR